ncbi:hypothetical protein KY289_026506 [Solanum tuberosum]|nr:hypothetical protein KY289_026506 [Solanum tuberosum]
MIIRKLTSGPADLDVISITGMPGSGKTTLAYKVYNDKSVSSHFDIRVWCTVGHEYDEKKLFHKILNQVTGPNLKFSEDTDVADMLRRQLFGKRYLIVLDDVWDNTTWDELIRPFPEFEKRRPEESWELLQKRAFGKESCPDELFDVGKDIAENCKGLPLVADLIAGVIAGLEKKKIVWLEVRNDLNSFILNSEVEVLKVIGLSYEHLPNHVKPSFLYLASFPKADEIPIYFLKAVWCAEGFVEHTEMKSVEEVMDVYLDNLISSSLVIALNDIGDDPSCRLHDLVHDFCLIKARKEKLFDVISSSAPPSSSDLMASIVSIDYLSELFGLNNFVLFSSKKERHFGKHLYSLLITGEKLDDNLSDICHIRHLRLLRMLFLNESFIMMKGSLLNEICMLNHLSGGLKVREVEILGTVVLSYSKDTEDIFKRLPNLQHLIFILKESWDFSNERSWFPKLEMLDELELLNVMFESSNSNDSGPSTATYWSWDFHFPSNLKKLALHDFPLTSDSLSTIGRLPNLEELTLRCLNHPGGE